MLLELKDICFTRDNKKILDNIKVTDSDTVVVIRDGEKQTIKKEEIVLDDTLYISSGDSILTDLEVLKSSSLEVDESMNSH